jgi:glyoxylase-like metal-dependent hydrolase (beta-lactamase superfamily II)
MKGARIMRGKCIMILASIAILSGGCGTAPDLDRTGLVRLTDNVYAFVAPGSSTEEGLGANSGFVVGSRGVLVVDARHTPRLAGELLSAVRSVTDAPILHLVYTHYHPDHTWGASLFSDEGAILLACPETGRLLEFYSPGYLEYYRQRFPLIYDGLKDVEIVPPDSIVEDGEVIDLGGIEVVLGCVGPAHTAGDCLVAVPGDRVLFAGGILSNGYHPNLGDPDADVDNWLSLLDTIEGEGYRYIVPGQGRVSGGEVIGAERDYIEGLLRLCRRAIRGGVPFDRAVQEISIPGTSGYEQANILPFNIQACYRREVLRVVRPPFGIGLPRGFSVMDGGGSTGKGRVQWGGEGGRMEIEVQWEPTSRKEIITQDIKDALGRYLGERPSIRMDVEESRAVPVGGEESLALHGFYRSGSEGVGGSTGFWTWVMTVRGGRAYLFKLTAGGSGSKESNLANLERLESTLAAVEFR